MITVIETALLVSGAIVGFGIIALVPPDSLCMPITGFIVSFLLLVAKIRIDIGSTPVSVIAKLLKSRRDLTIVLVIATVGGLYFWLWRAS